MAPSSMHMVQRYERIPAAEGRWGSNISACSQPSASHGASRFMPGNRQPPCLHLCSVLYDLLACLLDLLA